MNAFETELGVQPEIARAVDEMGWLLPTDVQGEAIPMILGGGDVLMAAETGSGKTGAFCLPILQIVHETLRDIQEGNKGPRAGKQAAATSGAPSAVQLSFHDRSHGLAIDTDGLTCQSRDQRIWNGARSTKGVKGKGRYYFEVTQTEANGIVRVGWSVPVAQLDLGTDNLGFGYGGTGKKSFAKQFDDYGETYGVNDVIGSLLDLDQMKIRYFKNGKDLGNAFDIPRPLQENTFFAHVCLKSCDAQINFGAQPFKTTPTGAVSIDNAPKECLVQSQVKGISSNAAAKQRPPNAPLAIIMEPSRELAQQTSAQIQSFQKYLDNPRVRELVIIGGVPVGEQTRVLHQGVDIIVATPGRLDELIGSGEIDLTQMRFFILDEADGLLSQGYKDLIMKLHRKMPSVTLDGKRLQMVVCSATLHNFEVKKLADSIMHFPTWVDLKGQDAVPETVHHVVCIIDPKKNTIWRGLRNHIKTDDVHLNDQLNIQSDSKETLSEAVKILKGEYCLQAIEKFKMDRALIFCRTKLDCDNLERYFIKQGGGPKSNNHRLSCVCLHSDRNPDERQRNLERFKANEVRFLVCTDVAARGIDVSGLPFVINMTLPDEKESYIHRIGRVGRAERMGLAISFVSTVPEKVWYHTCPSKGKNCHNTKLVEQHGCCKWYTEMTYLSDIEEHLGVTISQTDEKMDIPIDEFDGKVTYGQKRKQEVSAAKGHVDSLAATVDELVELEKRVQTSFFALRNCRNLMTA
ncbi:unnamed protein product [Adineta steineri]|uniref:ATP-dependent RNA helicase n=1 Tax=Adineta steineri TaxID=433720 RepID=A0A814ZM56_9BILA|nr:unnamed protein product [Adineta steineri]CAF1245090.1 unnamed protein product [Adineta steineri]